MLFLVISLLLGSVVGAPSISPSLHEEVIVPQKRSQCQNIRTQQRQIFEKMTRIESQLVSQDIKN